MTQKDISELSSLLQLSAVLVGQLFLVKDDSDVCCAVTAPVQGCIVP